MLVIICGTFRELDGSQVLGDSSSYAVRLLKEIFVIFWVEHFLRMTPISRKYQILRKTILVGIFINFKNLKNENIKRPKVANNSRPFENQLQFHVLKKPQGETGLTEKSKNR